MANLNPPLPDNLYNNGAVRFDTRQLANMLYQEQRQRQAIQAREDAELKRMYNQELGKVLAVDRPGAVQRYQDYKALKQSLLFDKKLQRDPIALADAQRKADLKMQDFLQYTGGSAERHNFIKENQKLDFDKRADDFGTRMTTYMNTPLDKLTDDLANPDRYRYTGTDYDPNPVFKAARGGKATFEFNEGPADKLTDKVTTYEFDENSPSQAKAVIIGAMGKREGNRYFTNLLNNLTPEDIKVTDEAYKSIPESVWKKMGREKVDLTIENPDNKAEVIATHLAQRMALENLPRMTKSENKINPLRKREQDLQDERQMALFKHGLQEQEIKLREQLKKEGEDGADSSLDEYLNGIERRAKETDRGLVITDKNGKVQLKQVPISPSIAKSFERLDIYGDKTQPEALGIGEDGQYYPIFYKKTAVKDPTTKEVVSWEYKKGKNGGYEIDEKLTTAVPKSTVKAELANVLLSPKLVDENLGDEGEAAPVKTKPGKPIKLTKGILD